MERSLNEIIGILSKHKLNLCKDYEIREIGVFGSFVRGDQKRGSDIDILVEFSEIPGLLRFIEIENHLRRILKKKVDLVRKGAIRPELKKRILSEVLYI
jgi:hypothetical protein